MDHPLLRFRQAAFLLAVVFVYGILGYVLIEGWDLHDAFFMTVTTIATVGYGEVQPLSREGELFTSTLIIGGVGTMLYGFGVFAETLSDDHWVRYRRRRRLEQRISALRDHFIICGYGRIGTQIAVELQQAGTPYLVIDINPEAIGRLERERRPYILGDAASEDVLRRAGIDRARGLISAVDSDERAVYITLAARSISPSLYILSRAGRPESIRRLELAGANRVVSPYRMAGHQMAELALRPVLVDVMDTIHHGGADIAVEELLVQPTTAALGQTLNAAGLLSPSVARLLALRRHDGTLFVNPGETLPLLEGDLIFVLGTHDQLTRTAELLR